MRSLLHILTKPGDALAQDIIALQKAKAENKVLIVDLTQPQPDYRDLLEKIFAADTVQTW